MFKMDHLIKIVLIILIAIPQSCGVRKSSKVFEKSYYSLSIDNEMPIIEQVKDSIFSMKCYIPFNCDFNGNNRQIVKKIIVIKHRKGVYLMRMASDTTVAKNRYWKPDGYWIVKKIDADRIKQYNSFLFLIQDKEAAERLFEDVVQNDNKFGFTSYSRMYLERLQKLPSISTEEDVNRIIDLTRSEKYSKLVEVYTHSQTQDIYGAGLAGELLTLSCIELGYNPIGAGGKVDSITRANKEYYEKELER